MSQIIAQQGEVTCKEYIMHVLASGQYTCHKQKLIINAMQKLQMYDSRGCAMVVNMSQTKVMHLSLYVKCKLHRQFACYKYTIHLPANALYTLCMCILF